jgi:hypothetical protein
LIGAGPIHTNHELVSNEKLKTDAPSQQDKENFLKAYRYDIQTHKATIAEFEELPEGHPGRKHISRAQKALCDTEAMIKKAESMDCEAGHVFAASGFRTTKWCGQSWILDWSVVLLKNNRSMENTWTSSIGGFQSWYLGEVSTDGPGDVENVRKVGRRDHANGRHCEGYINAIRSDIAALLPNGVPKFGNTARCLCILPRETYALIKEPFCPPGDSGSILLQVPEGKRRPVWFGLLFASSFGENLSHAYATPIGAVFKDIEAVTGLTVVNPQNKT